ncbi:MAG: saccharopine dehydrogenase NADP-binding domain-containing protein [Polyangiaceae bacterium]|nr:saccharopine dehydrogenase NADP-binding domain-containing protein [Polyangiaceae bacterium]
MIPRTARPYDLVLFGATSFVGQIVCRHLVARHGLTGPLRWAIAGRDAKKLQEVGEETGAKVERIVVDASDRIGLRALAESTRVIVSTVGPYAQYGSDLVAAVAEAGTDYCDLTGETQWIHRMIHAHEATAKATGARILHACGFDSVPSDLGVWFLQQEATRRTGSPCARISMRVKGFRGGASGGTIASMMNLVEEAGRDPTLRRLLLDPYALAPHEEKSSARQPNLMQLGHDGVSQQWLAPFVMAAVNACIVHRSHALLGKPWGDPFTYDEAMMMGKGPLGAVKAYGFAAALGGFLGLASVAPARRFLNHFVLPKAGEGPSKDAQATGFFDLRFYGTTKRGGTLVSRVTGDRDPGYGSTAKMLGETAFLLTELERKDVGGGFWTPSTAFGDRLIERLKLHAGLSFEVLDEAG